MLFGCLSSYVVLNTKGCVSSDCWPLVKVTKCSYKINLIFFSFLNLHYCQF